MFNPWVIPIGFAGGILAGYLGIGGGPIFVPTLFFFMASVTPENLIPKVSVATSSGAIVFTAIASSLRHLQLGHVEVGLFIRLAIGALIGGFFGGYAVRIMPPQVLTAVISVVLFLAALRMVTSMERHEKHLKGMKLWWLTPAGIGIGVLSATVGIGGGIMAVPILAGVLCLRTKKAAGTSAAFTLALAVSSVIGHIFWGQGVDGLPKGSLGFVNVPFALMLGLPAAGGAIVGAGLHRRFEPKFFRWIFAAILVLVASKIAFFD